jgi:hypothetical protein
MTDFQCGRCGRHPDDDEDIGEWSLKLRGIVVRSFVCPRCLTTEEHAEVMIRDAAFECAIEGVEL